MPKDRPPSSMNLPPTYRQKQTITALLAELRTVAKHEPTNRWEARDFIYKLRIQKKEKDNARTGEAGPNQTKNGMDSQGDSETGTGVNPPGTTQYR